MKNKLQPRYVIIKNCSESNDDFIRLYYIFRLTLSPEMSFRQFRFYYCSKKLQYIDVTFLYDGENVAGFCAAAFYSFNLEGKASSIGRSAIGLLEDYQGKSLPKWVLYYKYIRYKKKYPFKHLILTAYVANPLVYSMICKYTAIVYPRNTVQVSENINKIKELILHSSGLQKNEFTPFAVKIHFDVQKCEKLLHRIRQSNDEHVRFFITHTQLQSQITLLVIIPISWKNIILTSVRFIKVFLLKASKPGIGHLLLDIDKACQYLKKLFICLKNCGKAFNLAVEYAGKHLIKFKNANWKRL